jgi:hypothetical protein
VEKTFSAHDVNELFWVQLFSLSSPQIILYGNLDPFLLENTNALKINVRIYQ